MTTKINFMLLLFVSALLLSCNGQKAPVTTANSNNNESNIVGGTFENGEFMYIDMPENIKSIDTSAGWMQKGQKLLITGTMYKVDGKTPAPGVILYYYHTDVNGIYANRPGLDKRIARHGYIRGWVKSDTNGKYALYTVRPAPYPGRDFEAHIHPAIKEPGINNEYYIDEFVFDDDKLLTGEKRKKLPNRGGSGILRVLQNGDLQIAEHNIILGLNIPDYPKKAINKDIPELQIGEDQPSFTPFHAYGPDKGSRACPVCKYGRYHGIIYFVGDQPDWTEIKKWLAFLEQQSIERGKYLKAYFVYGNAKDYNKHNRQKQLEDIGKELNLNHVAVTFVPSFDDTESDMYLNKINAAAANTFVVFKNSTIVDKFINFKATAGNFAIIAATLEKTKGNYFNLPPATHH